LSLFLFNPQNVFAKPLYANKWLALPDGFTVEVISEWGQKMSDGLYVPGRPDGMGTFKVKNRTVIIRNHEVSPQDLESSAFGKQNELLSTVSKTNFFDYGQAKNPSLGGTTTLIFNERTGKAESQFLSLAGTNRNCAGGITPWNSWITCEEDVTPKMEDNDTEHGYNFEIPAAATQLTSPRPLKAMGRFNHEAVSVNPTSGFVYQTEDAGDGLIYRFIPKTKGKLEQGGALQALKIKGQPGFDTRNWEEKSLSVGDVLEVEWIPMEDVESPENDLRLRGRANGAAIFARGEGMWYGKNEIYFACTNGGNKNLGQVFKYIPSPKEGISSETAAPGKLVLFAESEDMNTLKNCDNLTVAPWGDVILCEDHPDAYIRGITPEGKGYNIARNIFSDSELAGICFSPSGKYMFVNIQEQGLTLAISGPWQRLRKP
jgi:secreted PhoX family phosphatase